MSDAPRFGDIRIGRQEGNQNNVVGVQNNYGVSGSDERADLRAVNAAGYRRRSLVWQAVGLVAGAGLLVCAVILLAPSGSGVHGGGSGASPDWAAWIGAFAGVGTLAVAVQQAVVNARRERQRLDKAP